jgi:hypothetical protein
MYNVVQIFRDKKTNTDSCPFCGEYMYQLHDEEKIEKALSSYVYESDSFVIDNSHSKTLGNKINEQLGLPKVENLDNYQLDNSVEVSDKEREHKRKKRKMERKARKKNRGKK